MRAIGTFAIGAVCSLFVLGAQEESVESPGEPVNPIVKEYGGVYYAEAAAEQPRKETRVIYDITGLDKSTEAVRGLEKVAIYLNMLGAAGLNVSDSKVVAILHGDATLAAMNDQAYARHFGVDGNPNLRLIRRLKELGVPVYVCLQAAQHRDIPVEEIAEEVNIALSAATLIINRQMEGYAYMPT